MLDFYYNGYNVRQKDDHVEIYLDSDLILTYNDRHGETIFGYRSPGRILEVREVLDHVSNQSYRESVG
jgi:hypothetical protein